MTKYALRLKSSSGMIYFFFTAANIRFSSPINLQKAPYRSPKHRVTRPGTRGILKPYQRLHATRETQQESEELAFYRRLHSYRERDDVGNPHQNGLEEDDGGDWTDESTIIAMFQEKCVSTLSVLLRVFARRVVSLSDPPEDEDCDIAELLDRLNDAVVAYRPGLRDYLKDALIPTIHHQTLLHDALRDQIDTSFATGVLSADQVCKNVESFRLKDEEDVTNLYSEVKVRIYPGLFSLTSLIPP